MRFGITPKAYLGKNDIANAEKQLVFLNKLAKDHTLKDITIWNINTTYDLVQIANNVLSAGIEAKKNNLNKAIALLNKAIAIEDRLNYNEPPDWFFSVRHYLGVVLLKAGKYAEAEKIYRQDLQTLPKNGFALIGLYNALSLQKKEKEALKIKTSFDDSWQYADMKIVGSSNNLE